MIAIVDYGLGNVKAFANIFAALNLAHVIAQQPADLAQATHAILPGVGAFDQAMQRLQRSGLRETLDEMVVERKLPVLGVCVGMQILMDRSEEGEQGGLGWLPGDVVRFRAPEGAQLHVPHIGWNTIAPAREHPLFAGLDEQAGFYFLHSYLTRCSEPDTLATTDYGGTFACVAGRDNILGVQFHPEKSHGNGIQLLRNFAEL
jgi:imidazole glycerol-phosphate synthase subunit HisH